jgi:hypothetical protein
MIVIAEKAATICVTRDARLVLAATRLEKKVLE